MLFGAKVVVDAAYPEIAPGWKTQVAGKAHDIRAVAEAQAAGGVGLRLVFAPYLRNQRIEPRSRGTGRGNWIAETSRRTAATVIRLVQRAIGTGHCRVVQVVSDLAGCRVRQQPQFQGIRGNVPVNGLRVWITEALIVNEEESLAAENLAGMDRPADGASKPAVVKGRKPDVTAVRRAAKACRHPVILVVLPGVRRPVVVFVVVVGGAVEAAGAAL